MTRCWWRILVLPLALVSASWSMPWSSDNGVTYADHYHGTLDPHEIDQSKGYNGDYHVYKGDCSNFGSQILYAMCPWAISWLPRFPTVEGYEGAGCKKPPLWVDDLGGIPRGADFFKLLTRFLHGTHQTCIPPDNSPRWRCAVGDFVFLFGVHRHFPFLDFTSHTIFIDYVDEDGWPYYSAHTNNR